MKIRMTSLIAILMMLLSAAVVHAAGVQRIHEIKSPLFASPAIVKAGADLTVKIAVPETLSVVEICLNGVDDTSIHNCLKYGEPGREGDLAVFKVKVPVNFTPALYDLAVNFSDNNWDYQLHAVKVVKEFKRDFYIVQLTDIHFNCQDFLKKDMNRIRRRLLLEINKLNPEFVMFTGDIGLDPETYKWDYIYGFEEFAGRLRVPMYMIPGNHEQYYLKTNDEEVDGDELWNITYGPKYLSFDYGNLHVIGMNTFDWPRKWRNRRWKEAAFYGSLFNAEISDEQWKWALADLDSAKARGQGLLAFTHIPIEMLMGGKKLGILKDTLTVQGPDQDQFAAALAERGCETLFVGHMHYNTVKKFGKLTEILTKGAGAAGGDTNKWGFQVIHIVDGQVKGYKFHEWGFSDLK